MSLIPLTLASLEELDGGKAAKTLERHLHRAAHDCYDRPGDGKARVVTLQIAITPVLDAEANSCSEVHTSLVVKTTLPPHTSRRYSLGLRPSGQLLFNPDSPTDVRQGTFLNDENEDD